MKHLPKIFLVAAILAFALGVSDLAENTLFYMGRPVGAICFVLFMIFQFLHKETALYDEEQERKSGVDQPQVSAPRRKEPVAKRNPSHIPAHSAV